MEYSVPKSRVEKPARQNSTLLSLVLRGGVFLSAAIIGLGLLLFLLTGQTGYSGDNATNVRQLINAQAEVNGQVYFPASPPEIWQGVTQFKPFAIISLGLLVLVATPVLNVALAALSFFQRRDRAFSLISLVVLAILLISFFLGKAGG